MLEDPQAGCRDIRFASALTLQPAAEVALEDYARVLARARHADVIRAAPASVGEDSALIAGVHVCGAEADCDGSMATDVEAFAREMAAATDANGLGWS